MYVKKIVDTLVNSLQEAQASRILAKLEEVKYCIKFNEEIKGE